MFIRHPALTVVPRHRRSEPLALSGWRARVQRARDRRLARRCRSLAAGYERLVNEADSPPRPSRFSAQVRVDRAAVRAVKPGLRAIAAALRSDRRPSEKGVRAAHRLLCDGCGPLYVPGDLPARVREVLVLLGEGGPPAGARSGDAAPRRSTTRLTEGHRMQLTATADTVLTTLAGHPHDSTASRIRRLVDPFDPGAVANTLDELTASGMVQHVGLHYALTTRGWREIRCRRDAEDHPDTPSSSVRRAP